MKHSVSVKMMVSICLVFVFLWVLPGITGAQEKVKPKKMPIGIEMKEELAQKSIPGFKPLSKTAQKQVAFSQPTRNVEIINGEHVASGIGLRNRGGGVINLRGVPNTATAHKAYLYWCFLGNSLPRCQNVSINGVEVKGSLVGRGNDPYWGKQYNFVYRAKVPTYLLYKGVNGDYKISGVPSSQGFGMSPWEINQGAYLAEGATLVVFFKKPSSTSYKTYLYDAPLSGTRFCSGFRTNLMGINATKSRATFTMIGADGQTGNGVKSIYFCTKETSFFQNRQIAGPPVSPPSSWGYHDADSDWNGSDGEPLNQLWDTRTHIVPIRRGSTSATVKYQSYGDCLVIVAFILTI